MPRVCWSTTAGLRCSLCRCSWAIWERSLGDQRGVVPLIDSGTDLEDELPMPDDSPGSVAVCSAGAAVP